MREAAGLVCRRAQLTRSPCSVHFHRSYALEDALPPLAWVRDRLEQRGLGQLNVGLRKPVPRELLREKEPPRDV